MPEPIITFVRFVDAINARVGKLAMYLILVLLGVLLYSAFSKAAFGLSPIWTVEMASFTLTTYYMLGGAYSFQNEGHVRMDLFYSRWSTKTKAVVDCLTIIGLLIYLSVLLFGGVESTIYAIMTDQHRPSAWRPPLWPIRSIMCAGIAMMLLQALSTLFKDIAILRGAPIR